MDDGVLLCLRLACVALGFPLVAFVFGWAVLRRWTRLDAEECFVAAWGVSFAVLAASAFVAFLLPVPRGVVTGCVVALMLGAAAVWYRQARPGAAAASPGLRSLAVLFALSYGQLLALQGLLPVYEGSRWYGDWWMHYDEALVFRGERGLDTRWFSAGYTLASRTPLFNLTAASVMSLAGNEFYVFQLAATLLSGCYVLPLYLLLRDLFGARAGRVGVLLASLNVWLVHNAWFTWSKFLVAYYLLLGLHLYLQFLRQRRAEPRSAAGRLQGAWASSLLAVMTHQLALLYLAPVMLHAGILAWRSRTYRLGLRTLCGLGLTALLIVVPWFAWTAAHFGIGGVVGGTPVTRAVEGSAFGPRRAFHAILANLSASFLPLSLTDTLVPEPRGAEAVYQELTTLYFSLVPGALTLSLTAFLVVSLFRGQRGRRTCPTLERRVLWMFALLGALGSTALVPPEYAYPNGCAHAVFYSSVLILLVVAWGWLAQAPHLWGMLTCCGILVEYLAMVWSHILVVNRTQLLDSGNLALKHEHQLLFLRDVLGPGVYACVVAAVAIQVIFIVLLFRELLRPEVDRTNEAEAEKPLARAAQAAPWVEPAGAAHPHAGPCSL